jgi:hypothetical protein
MIIRLLRLIDPFSVFMNSIVKRLKEKSRIELKIAKESQDWLTANNRHYDSIPVVTNAKSGERKGF